jgi:uncharacterized SAM-binding protein YcdF (DUF218 family)
MTWAYFGYKAAGAFLSLPGIFIAATFLYGLFLLFSRDSSGKRRSGTAFCILFTGVLLYLVSIPLSAKMLASNLEGPFSFDLPSPHGKTVVLVLSGGIWTTDDTEFSMSAETLQRFVAGVRAADALGCALLYTGGYPGKASEEQIRDMVLRTARDLKFDGPLLVEGNARTTWENLAFSADILKGMDVSDVVLVTTAYHLRRSLDVAERFLPGYRVHPYPSGLLEESGAVTAMDCLPSPSSFRNISAAVREIVGLRAYRLFAALSD